MDGSNIKRRVSEWQPGSLPRTYIDLVMKINRAEYDHRG